MDETNVMSLGGLWTVAYLNIMRKQKASFSRKGASGDLILR